MPSFLRNLGSSDEEYQSVLQARSDAAVSREKYDSEADEISVVKLAASVIILTAAAVAIGTAVGVGGYTFVYAKGASYMTNNAAACANCHVMQDHYDAWLKSPHRSVAVCNDCHTPPGLVPKYLSKAVNGWNHSYAFTTGRFHEPLQITQRNRDVTEEACRKCHSSVTATIDPYHEPGQQLSCIRCHVDVGHFK